MKLVGNKLHYKDIVLKAKTGTVTDNKLRYNLNTLKVGSLEFPILPIYKFSTEPNGTLQVLDNELVITIGSNIFTTNTLTFKTVALTEANQLALFTIQHGATSITLTNATAQEQTIRFYPDTIVTVTATNFATGAVDVESLIPTAGQVYNLAAVSTTVNSGSLDNVCVREEYDYVNSPTLFPSSTGSYALSQWIGHTDPGKTELGAKEYLNNAMTAYQLGFTSIELGDDYTGMPLNISRAIGTLFTQRPVRLIPFPTPASGYADLSTYPIITPQQVYIPQESGTFTLIADTRADTIEFAPIRWSDFSVGTSEQQIKFTLEANKPYLISFTRSSGDPLTNANLVNNGDGTTTATIYIAYQIYAGVQVFGPLTTFCAAHQTIDTRRTEYFIELTITPEN